jgi:hypothetical protein
MLEHKEITLRYILGCEGEMWMELVQILVP